MSIESKVKQNIPLAPLTTFRIGGPAKFLVEAETQEDLIEAINWAKVHGEKFYILGGGSNLLVSDKGFNGLIIKNNCREISVNDEKVFAGSGALLSQLVQTAASELLTGLEWAAGIPGTVGGAIRGNAGAHGSSIENAVESVEVYDPARAATDALPAERCNFAYRYSIFKEQPLVILAATLKLSAGSQAEIRELLEKYATSRRQGQPKEPSAGCVFKNILAEELQSADPDTAADARAEGVVKGGKIGAGWLIGRLGFKGKTVGGAMVSQEHANFIVNTGQARAEDVLILMSLIKQKVRTAHKVQLENEIVYLDY